MEKTFATHKLDQEINNNNNNKKKHFQLNNKKIQQRQGKMYE